VAGGGVQGFGWTPDATRLVYRADRRADQQFELYSAAPLPVTAACPGDGAGVNADVSGPLVPEGDVFGFAVP
jgi:hypothetical protein